jgi:hypothetical protein
MTQKGMNLMERRGTLVLFVDFVGAGLRPALVFLSRAL